MLKRICFIFLFLFTAGYLYGAEPIEAGEKEIDGIYIGKHIEYLSEKDLFRIISNKWQAEGVFKDKIKSGQLHSDKDIKLKIEDVPGGYKAHMVLRNSGKEGYIQWGLKDILRKEVLSEFKKSHFEVLRLNFNPHSYWLMFTIKNNSRSPTGLYLQLDKYLFNMVHLFSYKDKKITEKRGDFPKSIDNREVKDKKITFDIKVLPGTTTYFLRVDNWFMDVVPLRLWSKDQYYQHIAYDNALLGIISGIFLLTILYGLFIFLSMKDICYLYLALMAVGVLFIHIVVSGIGFQYLWPDNPVTGIFIFYGSFPFLIIFTLLFSRYFIGTYQYTPLIDKYILFMVALLIVSMPIIYIVPFTTQKILFGFYFITDHFYYYPLIFSAIITVRHGNRYGLFLLIGLVFYFLSQVEWILTSLNVIPFRFIDYLNIKGISFIIIMIMGLGYKFKVMRNLIVDYKIRLHKADDKLKNKSITDSAKMKIEQVKEFLKENFREDISREGLASAVEMSPDHLGRIFKKDTGKKIADYINKLRIDEAAKQLRYEENKIIDIAYEVGFESLRTFNYVFQNLHGLTPTEYRKNYENRVPQAPK
jgi:AraC-like DNA-binding protein